MCIITMIASQEQKNIVDTVLTKNVIVDSIAGCGKSSTVIFLSEAYPDKKMLVLTYNAALKAETRNRTKHLKNLDVDSYHSFATSNYDRRAYVDNVLNTIIECDMAPFNQINYDIIIVDESQDINLLYYRFVCKILNDNLKKTHVRMIVMGDIQQCIYRFKGADSRFITFAKKLFGKYTNAEWTGLNLSETFRCTVSMVNFLNNCVIGRDRLRSSKKSIHKPEYIITNSYGVKVRKILENYLKIYKPSEIFVLAYSVKDSTPIKTLANWVTNNTSTPIYISGSDQESLDSKVIEGKLVFSTIHSSKGRERPVVIFFGFDDSYFKYYDKTADKDVCPNELYVALTRSSSRMTIIGDSKNEIPEFVKTEKLKMYADFTDDRKQKISISRGTSFKEQSFTVSELVSYLSFDIENEIMKYITVKTVNEPSDELDIPNVVKIGELYETVSDITGISIPAYFEYTIKGSTTILSKNLVENQIKSIEDNGWSDDAKLITITKLKKLSRTINEFYEKNIKYIDTSKKITIDELLKISLYYSSQQSRTDYKLKQITKFDWVSYDIINRGIKKLETVVGKESKLCFEDSVERYYNKIHLMGEIDCIDHTNKIVYEFKCTKTLTTSHIIQLIIYAYIYKRDYQFKLFNILTGELIEISASNENLEKIIGILIDNKLNIREALTDTEFLGSVS